MAQHAFDGLWNEDQVAPAQDTDVARFWDIYQGPVEYRTSVGTRFWAIGHALGGLSGMGGRSRIEQTCDALTVNWRHCDQIIGIVDLSRVVALAAHFSNVIAKVGIKGTYGTLEKPSIRFLRVGDIVGSFGFPIDFVARFHEINTEAMRLRMDFTGWGWSCPVPVKNPVWTEQSFRFARCTYRT